MRGGFTPVVTQSATDIDEPHRRFQEYAPSDGRRRSGAVRVSGRPR